ncbi:PadR family transcriptional regulator [bacterium]|nr:PadR family transcriptional regulator [bacterium]
MQDIILLGFLLNGEKTGYQIKKLMEISTGYFFNTSLGSIYPAFNKLEKKNMVRMTQIISGGRTKKIYSITQKGREYFQSWLEEDINIPKIRDEALLKIFFFQNLSNDLRKERISSFLNRTKGRIKELEMTFRLIKKNTQNQPKKHVEEYQKKYNLDPFREEMLKFGLEYYSFLNKWYKSFLKRMDTIR